MAARSAEADARIRTGDPFITSEVLYQLSYVGSRPTVAGSLDPARPPIIDIGRLSRLVPASAAATTARVDEDEDDDEKGSGDQRPADPECLAG